MANAPIFKNLTPYYPLSYYGQEGVDITLQVDNSVTHLVEIFDNDGTLIGSHFHRRLTDTIVTFKIYPVKSGEYEITASAKDVTISNTSNSNNIIVTMKNKKEDLHEPNPDTRDEIAYIDLNFWFYKGCEESQIAKTMVENLTSSLGGYNTWDDYQESDFLPNIFSSSTLFKLLYTDNLMDHNINNIHHHNRNLLHEDFIKLPKSLQYSFDMYFTIQSLWVLTEVTSGTAVSILKDEANEYPLLEILRDSKKFTYQTDPNIIQLPMDESTFLTTYFDTYDNQSILNKAIIVELYYLHYNLNDNFVKYNNLLQLMEIMESISDHKSYHLMTLLYSFIVVNKIMKKKLLDVTTNMYIPDYWS